MARSTFYRALLLSVGFIPLAGGRKLHSGVTQGSLCATKQQHKTRQERRLLVSLLLMYTIHGDFLKRHSACGLGSCRPKPTCCR